MAGALHWDLGPGRGFRGNEPPSARAFLLSQLEPSQPRLAPPWPLVQRCPRTVGPVCGQAVGPHAEM